MIRFLLVLAAVTAYFSVCWQKIKLIPVGTEKTYYDNGKACFDYQYVLGGYHSEYKTYYSNGSGKERGTYNLGELRGVRERYNGDGSLTSRKNFVIGSCQGLIKAKSQSNSSLMVI